VYSFKETEGVKHINELIALGSANAVPSRVNEIDMLSQGIKVSQVAPGAAETEFSLVRYKGDTDAAANVYKGFAPLQAEDIANAVVWITGLPAHVTINDLVIVPTAQASPGNLYKEL